MSKRIWRDANFNNYEIGVARGQWYHKRCAEQDNVRWEAMCEGGVYTPDRECRCARCDSRDFDRAMAPYLADMLPMEAMHFL